MRRDEYLDLPSDNHFTSKSVTAALGGEIKRRGLSRIAGNIFLCKSTRDLWSIRNGKVIRLTSIEVDNGESAAGAPADDPGAFLRESLADLTF
jgi:hypothetical protein